MDKDSAAKLVSETFQNPFDKGRFIYFAKNLLKHIEEKSFTYRGNTIPDLYQPHIRTLQRVGKYEDPEGSKIDILVVHLKNEKALERARTMQRNFIAWYLDGSRGDTLKEAALVAFVSPDSEDWRFSLVKMDYKLDTSGKRLRVKKEPTPARRYSFLVGKNENSHTAQSRLVPILKDDNHNPTLEELESAFSVEKVTKEFFTKYRDLFHRVEEALKQVLAEKPEIEQEFSEKGIETTDFAKKLLGQIVFLYFLQKKGWFGVARDADWGTGPKDFLRCLFEKKYNNFFNDILEPLFYEALATERTGDFYSRFNCKIPFLNGGLFDPLANYDWVHTDILLPNKLFANDEKTKEGDVGTGILDIFDRYNFTVKEDEPLEKEVAVDPEMLGKVFENLLKVKDRKSKGTYYTPREIVHYMCQESLVNHLITETGVDEGRVRNLVNPKVLTKKDYRKYRRGGGSKGELFEGSALALWEGEPEKLDGALANINLCDPACGSGAFLVGMLQEIVHARKRLAFALDRETPNYELKQHAIQNSLYGVDIDPGAVEIAKLRLWLSLIVDEEDIKNIRPLPNLDYKIMQGNSLLEEYEGVELIDKSFFEKKGSREEKLQVLRDKQTTLQRKYVKLHSERKLTKVKKAELEAQLKTLEKQIKSINGQNGSNTEKPDLFAGRSEARRKAEKLQKLQRRFFAIAQKSEKDELKREIKELTWDLIETTLKEQGKENKLSEVVQFKKSNTKPFFLWYLNFSEVFQEKGGFDVVVGNPPYISSWNMGSKYKKAYERRYEAATGHYDIYVLFFEKGLDLLRLDGLLVFITSNKYLSQKYGYGIRRRFLKERILAIINFNFKVFEATVDSCITIVQRGLGGNQLVKIANFDDSHIARMGLDQLLGNQALYDELPQTVFEKIDDNNFRVNLTTDKLTLVEKIRSDTALVSDLYFVTRSICVHSSKLGYKKKYYIFDTKFKENMKKYIEAENFEKWTVKKHQYLNYVPEEHHRANFSELFEREGIMCKRTISSGLCFILNNRSYYCNDGVTTSVRWCDLVDVDNRQLKPYNLNADSPLVKDSKLVDNRYVLALLNSKLVEWFFYEYYSDGLHFYPEHLRRLPIKLVDATDQQLLIELVESILQLTIPGDGYISDTQKRNKVSNYEERINQAVYKLYNLTPEEIEVVENSN